VEKMMKALDGWRPEMPLREGLAVTIDWFSKNYEDAIKRW
jgi:nucleoside-diphosphate-sugar epimerase